MFWLGNESKNELAASIAEFLKLFVVCLSLLNIESVIGAFPVSFKSYKIEVKI